MQSIVEVEKWDSRGRVDQEYLRKRGHKHCGKCDTVKVLDDFARNKARYDNRSIWCKDCVKSYNTKRNERPEIKARNAELALARYHRMSDEEKAVYNSPERTRKWYLQGTYNVTLEWYEEQLQSQGGGCAICNKKPTKGRVLSVDHDHSCCPTPGESCGNCVRGLLCVTCNVQLHWMENLSWRKSAEDYLRNTRTTLF